MATVDDLRTLGYTIGLAHGSVQVEQDALDAARAAADPQVVLEQTSTLTADTLQTLSNVGKLPDDPAERLELATNIGKAALEMLTEHVEETVAFHEAALAIAQESPDVWHVEQRVGDITAVGMYVSTKADGTGWDEDSQAVLDALADVESFNERAFQVANPDAMQAASALAARGVELVRVPGTETWEAEGRTFTAADLPVFLDEVQARPVPPSTAEKVATAIAAAPEISAATKAALAAALKP